MPLTQIDPVPALIVIDLQKFVLATPAVHPAADIIERNVRLVSAFRARRLPVVLVRVAGAAPGRTDGGSLNLSALPADWTDPAPGLEAQADDLALTKSRWGAFTGTSLDDELRRRGVTQVFVTGVATSIGVESTARSAYELGYHVVPIVDAMTDRDADAHRHSVEKIFPRLGQVETTDNVLMALQATPANLG